MSRSDPVPHRSELSRAPAWLPLLFVVPALWLVRAGLFTGDVVGLPWGEAWGRLFVTGQVARWFGGVPVGWADQVDFPGGRAFWPVDPLVQIAAVPLEAIVGEATAWALVLAGLVAIAGIGGYAASRRAGAPWPGALAAGMMLAWNPFLLRNAAEGVTEVLAIGFVALAAAAAMPPVAVGFQPTGSPFRTRRGLALFASAVAGICGTSPYFAVYAAFALLVSAPLWPADRRRDVAAMLAVATAVGLLFAVPIALTESGEGGRLSSAWAGGYRLLPEPLVRFAPDGGLAPVHGPGQAGGDPGRAAQSAARQALVQWPGGIAVTCTLVAGLADRRTRRPAALGLAWLLLGPAWALIGRWAGDMGAVSPMQRVFLALPGTSLLGNANRQVVIPIVIAAIVAGPLLARWPRAAAAGLAALVLGAAILEAPPLSLPAVEARAQALPGVIDGATITFPSGDPPLWNPGPWPKEGLWRAKHHGGPQAYDYGRGGIPADAPALVRLSEVAGLPLGRRAAETLRARDEAEMWRGLGDLGFTRILVVRRTLDEPAYGAVRGYLVAASGPPLVEDGDVAVWALPGASSAHP